MSAALRLIRGMLSPRITLAAFVLFIPASQCSAPNDSSFVLTNKATGFCLLKKYNRCLDIRWTTGNRLFVTTTKKCLGAQGKSVGSEVSFYDCDEKSALQKWECQNDTLLALKDQPLYIEIKADESVALSKTVGPNNHLTITGTASGACSRTYRELYTIEGNAFGKICMFPFMYKDRWFADCTTFDSSTKRNWCAIETKYEHEQWGYCPTSSTDYWNRNPITGAYYQLNTQSALTWSQADTSCKQQSASLVSIIDPNEKAYISALLASGKNKLWLGLVLDPEHGWQWSDGRPFRYLRWEAGHPLPNPGHNCAFLNTVGQYSWQSSSCAKKMGYICYKDGAPPTPPQFEQGSCPSPWIPYNGHCFHLNRNLQTWLNAQTECRKEGGELVSIRNVEDQSFVISQLGYGATDELWIGLNDRNMEGLFDWSDHSTVSFTSWEYGKPTVSTENEDCVLIRGQNGNWADRACDEKHGFICMKQSSTDSTVDEVTEDIGCKAGWKRHGSYCYFVGTETKTFDEAKADCESSSSYLVDVSNGVDNAFLVSLVGWRPEKHFWLGLSNQKNVDVFVWTNTDSVTFTHWNAQMPGYERGCVAMTSGIFAGLWDVLPCTNREKYICKYLADGATVTVPPPTVTPPQCADGWNRVGTRNVCVKFFTGPRSFEKTWFEARDYCREIGGDLLSIHNAHELNVGRGGKGWIGLHVPDSNSGYVWSDGTPLNFQHWQNGEPNNFMNSESCAEFVIHNQDEDGSWNDVHCESYNDWLCQIRAGDTPKQPPNNTATDFNTTSDGWLVWGGNQYFINKMSKPMEEARHFCQQRHGELATVNSKKENIFLWKQISRSYGSYFIGLSVELDGSFWWMDGTPVSYQRWDENQPNLEAYDENCVAVSYHMGFWRTTNCGRELQSICKRSISVPANTTAAPTVPPKGGCQFPWMKFGSKCYNIITDRRTTWEEARHQCGVMRSKLVSITTRNVQAFLVTKMVDTPGVSLWIGLNAIKQDGFYWTDGKSRKYTNWGYSKVQRRPGTFYQRWNEENCVLMVNNYTSGIGKWMVRNCNDSYGFVCHRSLDTNIAAQPDSIDPNIYVRMGNDSIKVVTQNLTWDQAKQRCESEKATLANLRNEWTHAHVELLAITLQTPLWIGLNKEQTGGYFRYIDGWHLSSASWAPSEPLANKPCVYLDVDGKWKTAFCNQTMNSVCMQTTDVAPTDSNIYPGHCPEDSNLGYHQTYSWLPFKSHCYLFITDEIEWADAASSCVRHGGTLASIQDASEQQFIKSSLESLQDSHTSFWIGLFKTHKGDWLWLDKTVMDYTNWGVDEPDSDYGSIRTSDGFWNSGRRWHDRGYICKTPKVLSQDPESNPDPHRSRDPRSRVHTSVIVVLVIAVASILMAVGFFLYKKSPLPLPTFENPLYFNSEQSPPDVVDTNKIIENAENPEPILTL
ncbi:macrophage mannose receptor 1-like isoform X2 [Mugil cephalus]|uniref:macrophage mannose receptor 1-like isoform X2 n=1 Tax=Mugil cephalus TaxID=48193 RepID=UPI001FB5A937|nr:macrophage mannose receptor 1-like isoform X2 [Mugil cephalus]